MLNALKHLFGGEIKVRILQVLLSHPEQSYHLRGLAAAAGTEYGNTSKALKALVASGVVQVIDQAPYSRYQANTKTPIFEPLRQLFLVSGELMEDLKAVARMLDAEYVAIFGSVAKGTDRPDSDIDVLVVGPLTTLDAQAAFKPVSRKHKRQVNALAISLEKLSSEAQDGSPFWEDVFANKLITLAGEKPDVAGNS